MPATVEELVLLHRDKLNGIVADAATSRPTGAELSLRLRTWFKEHDQILKQLVEEARKGYSVDVGSNGKPVIAGTVKGAVR